MADFINTVDVIGDEALVDGIIDRTITEFKDNSVKTIGSRAFDGCKQLVEVDCPEATTIKGDAFNGCDALTKVNAPAATLVESGAFTRCTSLTEVNLPELTTMTGSYCFEGCTSLVSIDLPKLTTVDQWGNGLFQNCGALASVNLPLLTMLGPSFFSAHFGSAPVLEKVDLPSCTWIGSASLVMSTLETLILRSNTVCSLNNVNAFNTTKIKAGTGYIYVPSALVDEYKVATNWSTYATQFRALEDYTVDGTVTGELDETKI